MNCRLKPLLWVTITIILGAIALASSAWAADDLPKNFTTPPDAARPWVYWFWLNGNITKEGITADLEAMKNAGIGGVLIMEVDQGAPVGPVDFMSDRWRKLFEHVAAEANRLGLEVNMNNDGGWTNPVLRSSARTAAGTTARATRTSRIAASAFIDVLPSGRPPFAPVTHRP
jgi:hypothetical protein